MPHRRDYYNDPQAPAVNSIVPAVTVVAMANDKILLEHRVDNGLWALPGGALDPGESAAQAAVRETLEETGIHVTIIGVVGIYTDPGHIIAYSDGEVRQQFSICLAANPQPEAPKAQKSETKQVAWVPLSDLDGLTIHPAQRLRIDHGIAWKPGDPANLH